MHTRTLHRIAAGLIVLLAILLRLRTIDNDLRIDEIWSLQLASSMHSPFDLFSLHWDNNHYLNTLWLYYAGLSQPFWTYRIPSFLCGIGLVIAVIWSEWKKHPITGLVLGSILAASAFLTTYSTEARGYMPMLFFGFLSYLQMQRTMNTRKTSDALAFGLLSMISFLWQLMYIHLFLALMTWYIVRFWSQKNTHTLTIFFISMFPSTLLLYLLAITDFVSLKLGGAPASTPLHAALESASVVFGLPLHSWMAEIVGLGALVSLIVCTESIMQKDRSKGAFYLTLFALSPIALILVLHTPFFFARYFSVSLLFAILLLGTRLIGGARHSNLIIRGCCITILCAFIISNLLAQKNLTTFVRGYTDSLMFLTSHATKQTITIGSSGDFRTKLLLWFYVPYLETDKKIVYLDRTSRRMNTPDYWFIDNEVEPHSTSLMNNNRHYAMMPNAPNESLWDILQTSSTPQQETR